MVQWLSDRGLRMVDGEGTVTWHEGYEQSLWNGSGLLTVVAGDPPTYATGVWVLARIYGQFFLDDHIEGSEPDDPAWLRSKIAAVLKANGTPGTLPGVGIDYYEWEGVRVYTYISIQEEILSRGLAGHGFL